MVRLLALDTFSTYNTPIVNIKARLYQPQDWKLTPIMPGYSSRGASNTACASRAGLENECQDLTDQEDEWYSLVHFLESNFSVARKLT
jgi:hypothetical protein